jgi:hypothetical protein
MKLSLTVIFTIWVSVEDHGLMTIDKLGRKMFKID